MVPPPPISSASIRPVPSSMSDSILPVLQQIPYALVRGHGKEKPAMVYLSPPRASKPCVFGTPCSIPAMADARTSITVLHGSFPSSSVCRQIWFRFAVPDPGGTPCIGVAMEFSLIVGESNLELDQVDVVLGHKDAKAKTNCCLDGVISGLFLDIDRVKILSLVVWNMEHGECGVVCNPCFCGLADVVLTKLMIWGRIGDVGWKNMRRVGRGMMMAGGGGEGSSGPPGPIV